MPLGLYISVPFCRTKCSYCNFASDVFSRAVFERYVDRVCADLAGAEATAGRMGAHFEGSIDSIYLGGGTPTILEVGQLRRLFVTISQNFRLPAGGEPPAEITVECAPGTLTPPILDALAQCGVNRVSLGVQSFVDEEARAVGRLHSRAVVLDDIARLRAAGISNINVDLIAGLPHQTAASWQASLDEVVGSGVPHVSVYMLEVDEDSRLGRELIAGGTRYHAHFVPDDDLTVELYTEACEKLESAGIHQYEISNFARGGCESRHNLKYWTRQPYFGVGVDAHSMLRPRHVGDAAAIRFATPETLEAYVAAVSPTRTTVSRHEAVEESFFLGLRLNRGVDMRSISQEFGEQAVDSYSETIAELIQAGMLSLQDRFLRLTPRGRLLSNEVFQRFLVQQTPVSKARL